MSALDWSVSAWSTWMSAAAGELTLVLLAVWVVDRHGITRLHPTVRNGLWLLVLARLVLPPALVPEAPLSALALPGQVAQPVVVRAGSAGDVLFAVWLSGIAWLAVTIWRRSRAAAARLRPASSAERSAAATLAGRAGRSVSAWPALFVSAEARSPYVTGVWRPRLVLPSGWHGWPAERLTHAIEHELAHVRRRDLVVEACWTAAAVAYWFHPLVWLCRRRAHEAREACVDAQVAAACGPSYRQTLLEMAAAWHGLGPDRGAPVRHGWGPIVARLKVLDRWPARPSPAHRLRSALALLAAAWLILPTHAARAPGIPIDVLTDPASRQEAGLGSLHVRYELLRRSQEEGRRP